MPFALLKSINTDYLTNVLKLRGFSAVFRVELAARRFQVKGIRTDGDEMYWKFVQKATKCTGSSYRRRRNILGVRTEGDEMYWRSYRRRRNVLGIRTEGDEMYWAFVQKATKCTGHSHRRRRNVLGIRTEGDEIYWAFAQKAAKCTGHLYRRRRNVLIFKVKDGQLVLNIRKTISSLF